MSLINQMLKDLEHRRSQDVEGGGAAIMPGIKQYSVARRRRSPWIIVLSSVSAVLVLVISWLLWDKMSQPEVIAASEEPVSVNQVQEPSIVKTTTVKSEPVVVKTPVTQKSPGNKTSPESAPVVKKVSKPEPVVKKKVVKTINADDAEVDTAPAGTVKKITRSLEPGQQAEVYYKKGHSLLSRGQSIAGEQSLRKALATYPKHIKAREILAGLYIKTGRVVEASELLEQGVIHNPGHSLFAMLQARLFVQQNRLQAAIHVLENNAPDVAANLDYHALMAVAYQKQGLHEKTVNKYQQVLSAKPTAGVWWVGMAISLESLGKQQQAADAYNKARKTGTLTVDLLRYTDSRLALLRDSGYSHSE